MANTLRASFKQKLLNKELDMDTDGIRCILYDTDADAYNSADDFLDDILSGARVAVSGDLTSPTITNGVFDTADFAFTSVSGAVSERLELYDHGMAGADSGRALVANYDTVSGLPITPNGQNINVTVHASGWFSL